MIVDGDGDNLLQNHAQHKTYDYVSREGFLFTTDKVHLNMSNFSVIHLI